MTIDEIAEQLSLSRTTVYAWVRDLPLGRSPNWSTGQRRGARRMQEKYKRLREEAYQFGAAEYEHLMKAPTFRDFVALYVAEGTKRNRNMVEFANSDPRMMALAVGWLGSLTAKPCHTFGSSTTPIKILSSYVRTGARCFGWTQPESGFSASRTVGSWKDVGGAPATGW